MVKANQISWSYLSVKKLTPIYFDRQRLYLGFSRPQQNCELFGQTIRPFPLLWRVDRRTCVGKWLLHQWIDVDISHKCSNGVDMWRQMRRQMSINSCLLVIERINPSSSHQIPTTCSTYILTVQSSNPEGRLRRKKGRRSLGLVGHRPTKIRLPLCPHNVNGWSREWLRNVSIPPAIDVITMFYTAAGRKCFGTVLLPLHR